MVHSQCVIVVVAVAAVTVVCVRMKPCVRLNDCYQRNRYVQIACMWPNVLRILIFLSFISFYRWLVLFHFAICLLLHLRCVRSTRPSSSSSSMEEKFTIKDAFHIVVWWFIHSVALHCCISHVLCACVSVFDNMRLRFKRARYFAADFIHAIILQWILSLYCCIYSSCSFFFYLFIYLFITFKCKIINLKPYWWN